MYNKCSVISGPVCTGLKKKSVIIFPPNNDGEYLKSADGF